MLVYQRISKIGHVMWVIPNAIDHPPVITIHIIYIYGINLPFPVMGGLFIIFINHMVYKWLH